MRPGWYVLAFHEIAWEENPFLSGLNITYPPDAFAAAVEQLHSRATLIGVDEGFEKWRTGSLDKAYVSFWFDDGYAGVRRYALPILQRFGVSGAISINSRFADRREMFWRAKLSFLSCRDGMRFVRSRLRGLGLEAARPVRQASLDLFSPALLDEIDAVYQEFTSEVERADAFRLFDSWEGLAELKAAGWTISNHSAAHYPLIEPSALALLGEQFDECEHAIASRLAAGTKFWVAPFDRSAKRAPGFQAAFDACAGDRTLVLVGNQVNGAWHAGKPVSRIGPPADLARLVGVLEDASIA